MKKYLFQNKFVLFLAIATGALSAISAAFVSILLQKIIDIAMSGESSQFLDVLIFTLCYLVFLSLIGFTSSLCAKRLIRNVTISLRKDVFYGIMKKQPMEFQGENTADYLSALTNDIKMVEENYLVPILSLFDFIFMFFATAVLLLYLSPIVTLCLVVGMALMFIVPALFGKALEKRQDRVSKQLSYFTTKTKDLLSGYEVIRNFSIFPLSRKIYDKENQKTGDVKFAADKLLAVNEGLSDSLSLLSIIVVIFLGAYLVMIQSITVGTLIALVQLSGTFLTPIIMLMQMLPKIKGITPVVERLEAFSATQIQGFLGETTPTFSKDITVKDLSFSYVEDQKILNNVDFTFEKGKKYAILGKSGCGKSTLIKLLSGFSHEYDGKISYDNIELENLNIEKINELVSVIHQNIYMFDTTIKENIGLFREFPAEEWDGALKNSGVVHFLSNGGITLDSQVGENGSNLSGGQRQRIAVARALIQKTPILIIDEGTSSVDQQTAMEIETKLLNKQDLTLITITHGTNERLLQQYDEILFMEEGKITLHGSIHTLLEHSDFQSFFTNIPKNTEHDSQ